MVGLGGARCVNRRYVADYISLKLRTRFSVISVACATFGTALGSIIGGLCTLIPETTVYGLTVNPNNSPAIIMAFAFIIFLIVLLIKFKEPEIDRSISSSEKAGIR